MMWKVIGIVLGIILFLGAMGAVVYKIVQKTEGYKAQVQNFYTNEPHFGMMSFGCSRYQVVPEAKK